MSDTINDLIMPDENSSDDLTKPFFCDESLGVDEQNTSSEKENHAEIDSHCDKQNGVDTSTSDNSQQLQSPIDQESTKAATAKYQTNKVLLIPAEKRSINSYENTKFIINKISKTHSVSIETSEGSNKEHILKIRGKSNDIDEAINDVMIQLVNPIRISIPEKVDKELIRLKSNEIDAIENELKCRIVVHSSLGQVAIYTTSDNIEKAATEKLEAFFKRLENLQSSKIVIPHLYHPWIRGPHCKTIMGICAETKADVIFENNSNNVFVFGQSDSVERASLQINEIFNNMKDRIKSTTFDLPRVQQSVLRDNNFELVNEILEISGVYIELPSSRNSTRIILHGLNNSRIGEALSIIHDLTSLNKSETIEFPSILHKLVRGHLDDMKNNHNMKKIYIELSRGHITLKGSAFSVKKIKTHLDAFIAKMLKETITEIMNLSPKQEEFLNKDFKTRAFQYSKKYNVSVSRVGQSSQLKLQGFNDDVQLVKEKLLSECNEAENNITQVLPVNRQFHRLIIGDGGSKINEIKEKFKVGLHVPNFHDRKDEIVVEGSIDAVSECCQYINQFVEEQKKLQYVKEIEIDKSLHKVIIGPGGSSIQDIRRKCRASVEIPEENNPSNIVKIYGKEENVNAAIAMIERLTSSKAKISVEMVQSIYVHLRNIGVMEEIKRKYPRVHFEKKRGITLHGDQDEIQSAAKCIEDEIEKIKSLFVRKPVELNLIQDAFIQNNHNKFMSDLASKFNVSIVRDGSFPNKPKNVTYFVFEGLVDNVESAMQVFLNKLDKMSPIVQNRFVLERDEFDRLYNNYSKILFTIKSRLDVDIGVYNTTCEVNIRGNADNVKMAERKLRYFVGRMADDHNEKSLNISKEFHARIIGKKGFEINRIRQQSSIDDIIIPARDDPPETPVILRGSAEAIAIAENLINQIIQPPNNHLSIELQEDNPNFVTIDIPVKQKYHKALIGKGGRTINRLRRNYNVEIVIPQVGSDVNQVQLYGAVEDCENAKKEIELICSEFNDQSKENKEGREYVSKTIIIDPNSVSRLIGTKGRNIQKFREQFKVDVKFNYSEDNPDVVLVSGPSNQIVDDAVEALLNMSLSVFEARRNDNRQFERYSANDPPDTSDLSEFPRF